MGITGDQSVHWSTEGAPRGPLIELEAVMNIP